MNHAGEKEFKALAIAFGLGLIIAFIAIAYLDARLRDYEVDLDHLHGYVHDLERDIKVLEWRIDSHYNETRNLELWATDADTRIRDIEGEIEDFKNLSGWRLEDIYWKILDLEDKLIGLEARIKLLETP
jgi:hypothetical protein